MQLCNYAIFSLVHKVGAGATRFVRFEGSTTAEQPIVDINGLFRL